MRARGILPVSFAVVCLLAELGDKNFFLFGAVRGGKARVSEDDVLFTELFTQECVHLLGSSNGVADDCGASVVIGERFEHVQDAFGAVVNEFQLDFGLLYGLFNLPFLGSSIVFGGKRVDDGVIQIKRRIFSHGRCWRCLSLRKLSHHSSHHVIILRRRNRSSCLVRFCSNL